MRVKSGSVHRGLSWGQSGKFHYFFYFQGTVVRMVSFKPNQIPEIMEFVKSNALLGYDVDDDVIAIGSGIGVFHSQDTITEKLGKK